MTYGLGISATDFNTANYVQSVQAMDGLSNAAVSGIYNQSIFGTNGFGYSTIPFAGVNTDQMLQYQQQLNNNNLQLNRQNIDSNLTLNKQNQAASKLSTASDDSISRQIASLQRQVQNNKQDNIMPEYNKLVSAVAQYFEDAGYTNVSEAQIKATAEKMYAQVTGNALVDDIKAHGNSAFGQGFKQVMTFGLESGRTASQNIQSITGENSDDAPAIAGKWAGRVVAGAALLEGGRLIAKFAKSPAGKATWNVLKKIL